MTQTTHLADRARQAAATLERDTPLVRLLQAPARAALGRDLHRRLCLRAAPALIEEDMLREALAGRFDSPTIATATLGPQPGAADLAARLPELSRLLDTAEADWRAAVSALLCAFAEDAEALGDGGLADGAIAAIDPALSDPHDGGKMTARITLAGGGSLIFKPRALDMETALAALLSWLSRNRIGPDLRAAAVLVNRTTHGWMENVAHLPCQSPADLVAYHHRAGALLCLAALLQATDLHRENLVAHGAWPVIVDAETLLQPRPSALGDPDPQTLLRDTGLLPPFGIDAQNDMSGLCSHVAGIAVPDTPHPELACAISPLPRAHNLPRLGGQVFGAAAFPEAIHSGFAEMFAALVRCRAALCANDGPLQRFAHARARYVARSTQAYGRMLDTSLGQNALRSTTDRAAGLKAALDAHSSLRAPRAFLDQEMAAMMRLDVPRLVVRPDVPGPNHCWRAPLSVTCQRLASLKPSDLLEWRAAVDVLFAPARLTG